MFEVLSCRPLTFAVYTINKAVLSIVVFHLFGVKLNILNPIYFVLLEQFYELLFREIVI